MSSQDVYSQVPIVTARREVRILALVPGIDDDALCRNLIVESLDYDDLHYTALSYTWSGAVRDGAIIIGGVSLRITENLKVALHGIRGPTRPKNLWIDAICINQSDSEEKTVQVSMMGDIYASATRTIVWLGEKSADSDMAMDFIGSIRQRTLDKLEGGNDVDSIPLRAVAELMRRKWWTRIWVVQEALMSRRVIVQCGERKVEILCFVQFASGNSLKESFLIENKPEEPQITAGQSFLDKRCRLSFARGDEVEQPRRPFKQPFIDILSKWYAHKQHIEAGGLSLRALISLTHGFQASVRRDRIFALLGLATPEARSHVVPDYSDAASDHLILTRLTMFFLRTSLQPLRLACYLRATDSPSWVTDWTAIGDRILELMEDEETYHRDHRLSSSYLLLMTRPQNAVHDSSPQLRTLQDTKSPQYCWYTTLWSTE